MCRHAYAYRYPEVGAVGAESIISAIRPSVRPSLGIFYRAADEIATYLTTGWLVARYVILRKLRVNYDRLFRKVHNRIAASIRVTAGPPLPVNFDRQSVCVLRSQAPLVSSRIRSFCFIRPMSRPNWLVMQKCRKLIDNYIDNLDYRRFSKLGLSVC